MLQLMFNCKLYAWCRFRVLSFCEADNGIFQEKEVTDSVPSILSAVLIIKEHRKPIESSLILTLSEDKLCS